MNILLTGNNGYIGSVLTDLLLKKGYAVTGFDTNYYAGCEFTNVHPSVTQITKDIRKVSVEDLKGIDAIIHLAALSNDPIGAFNPELTYDINYKATVRLAELAKSQGIKRFVYASSCSSYGVAGDEAVTEESPLAPVTAYAISKVKSEESVASLADSTFSPTFLRPSTAYGVSPMLRCDVVLNNLVGWAFTTGKIRIMSDGLPWRPVVHVEDFARAFIACIEAPIDLIHNEAFNLGQNKENYQVKDMATIVEETVPNCEVEYTGEHGSDSRTYRVSFDKINTVLKDYFKPQWDLRKGAEQVYNAFKEHGLTEEEFTGHKYTRLTHLEKLIAQNNLDSELFWQHD